MLRKYENPFWLIREYIHKGRYLKDIAEECDAATSTVHKWIVKFGISKRKKIVNTSYKNKAWLIDQYITKRKSAKKIAEEVGVYVSTIQRWIWKYEIKKVKYQ